MLSINQNLQTIIDGQLFPGHAVGFVSGKQVLSHDVILSEEKSNLSFQVTNVIPSFLCLSSAVLELNQALAPFLF